MVSYEAWASLIAVVAAGWSSPTCDLLMDDPSDQVPDELEEQLDDLSEELRDPERADRGAEDQGEEGQLDADREG